MASLRGAPRVGGRGGAELSLLSTASREGDVFGQKLAPTLSEVPALPEDLDCRESR